MENLSNKKERLLQQILQSRGLLLVIDMQVDFVSDNGKSKSFGEDITYMQAIIPKIAKVVDKFREANFPVVFTKVYENPEMRNVAQRDRYVFFEKEKIDEVTCMKGTPGAELVYPVDSKDYVVEKITMSAYNVALKQIIEKERIETVYITGVKTHRCVASTVRDLYDWGNVHVVILEDCVATDDQEQHNATMKEFKTFYPPVVSSTMLLASPLK